MKTLVVKALRNFLLANLCAVVPLWAAAFGWMPDEVQVYMQWVGAKTVKVVADGAVLVEKYLGTWEGEGGHKWGFHLQEGMAWEELSFRLPPGVDPEAVARVELRKWKLVRLCKAGRSMERVAGTDDEFAFRDPRFERVGLVGGTWTWVLAGVEGLLLVLSWWAARRRRGESWKSLVPSAAGVVLPLALLTVVVLPVGSYVANRSAFPFPPGELARAIAWRFPLAWGLGTAALALLARCFGRWVMAPVLAFAFCAHLESAVLSSGLPVLNGDWTFFADRTRTWWDAGVWAAAAVAAVVLHPVLAWRYGRAGLCLAVLVGGTLAGARPEPKTDVSKLAVDGFSTLRSVIRSVEYSTNRNVMVFVIDSLEREQAHAVMEDPAAGPELREKFRGFTEYLDNVGAGNTSLPAVANLFTGKYPESADGVFDHFVSVYSPESALCDYLEAGNAVYMATDALGYGYSNRARPTDDGESGGRKDCWHVPGRGGGGWTLPQLARFRWLPFGLKARHAEELARSTPESDFEMTEWKIYPMLRESGVSPTERGVFLFVHTHGVHIPVFYDRDGGRLYTPGMTDEAGTELAVFLLRCLGDLFDSFRERDIYDRSLILVLADHGRHRAESDPDVLPQNARPFLWVKPAGSRHGFRGSDLPTSHARISDLLRAACRRDLTEEEIGELLRSDRRRYRQLRGGIGPEWQDWTVDRTGAITYSSGVLDSGRAGGMRPLATGSLYSLDHSDMGKNNLDITFLNADFWPCPTLLAEDSGMRFTFRVPDPVRRYALNLVLKGSGHVRWKEYGTVLKFRQADAGRDWESFLLEPRTRIVLHGLVPDPDGRVEIEAERGEGLKPSILLTHILLEEEP